MPFLQILEGTDKNTAFNLDQKITTIGRNPDNQIVISDPSVSRFHVKIICRDKKYYIQDMRSAHGTFVNNNRIDQETLLEDNTLITLGTIKLVFSFELLKDSKLIKPSVSDMYKPILESTGEDKGDTIALTMLISDKSGKHLTDTHWEMLSRIADATLSVFELEELLNKLMDMLFEVFKPDRGIVLLYDKTSGELTPKIRRPETGELKISQTIIKNAVDNQMSLLIADTQEDQRFKQAQSIVAQSISSAICSPLVRKDKVLGVIYIDAQSRPLLYQKEDLALLNIIAANAAISIENAILFAEKVHSERLAAIGVAVAGISHYVKNLIQGITGSESVIEMAINQDNMDTVKGLWPIQKRSVKKISTLIQDMLTYSKAREPNWENGNLNTLLNEVYEDLSPRANDINVVLELELVEGLNDSEFDQKAIHDAILNIVGNAIDACAEQGDSLVRLKTLQPDEDHVSVWIIDNGPGIPENIQKKIFEPFFSTKGSKGTGLGLAIVKKNVEEHHGTLTLESAPGKGTTFKITLPRHSPDKPTD